MADPVITIRLATAQTAKDADAIKQQLRGIAAQAAQTQKAINAGSSRSASWQKEQVARSRALTSASEQAKNLTAQIQRLNLADEQQARLVDTVNTSLQRYAADMRRAAPGTAAFVNAQLRMRTALGNVRREVGTLRFNQVREESNRLAAAMRDLGSTATLVLGPLSGVGSRVLALGSILNRENLAAAGFFGTIALGIHVMHKAVTAATNLQERMGLFQGVLRATGKDAMATAGAIEKIVETVVSKTPGGSTEGVQQAAAALLSFKGVDTSNLENLLSLSADLAAVFETTLPSAAEALGRALEDPETQLTRLARRIPALRGPTGDLIKHFEEIGQQSKAQSLLLETLQQRVGGVAESMNTGIIAASGNLSQQWRRLMEVMGSRTHILEHIAHLMGAIADNMERAGKYAPPQLAPLGAAAQFGPYAFRKYQNQLDMGPPNIHLANLAAETLQPINYRNYLGKSTSTIPAELLNQLQPIGPGLTPSLDSRLAQLGIHLQSISEAAGLQTVTPNTQPWSKGMAPPVINLEHVQRQTNQMVKIFESASSQIRTGIASAIDNALQQGKLSFKDFAQLAESVLYRIVSTMAATKITSALGFATGGGASTGFAKLLGFATGGSFIVGGGGGTDSQLVAFKGTPGERVDVTPPGKGGASTVIQQHISVQTGLPAQIQAAVQEAATAASLDAFRAAWRAAHGVS